LLRVELPGLEQICLPSSTEPVGTRSLIAARLAAAVRVLLQ
jgi:hypothetical protein